MQDNRYAFSVTSVRVKEASLLGSVQMDQLIAVPTFDGALAYLAEHGWQVPSGKVDVNLLLRTELLQTWEFLREISPEISLLYPFILRNDYHNIKAGIKSKLSNLEIDAYFLSPSTLPAELLIEAIKNRHFNALPEPFSLVAEEAYDVLVRTGDGQLSDIIIDACALTDILAKAKTTKNQLVLDLCELFCAAANIKTAWRAASTMKNADFLRRALSDCDTLDKTSLITAATRGSEALLAYLVSTAYADGSAFLPTSPATFEKWCDDQAIALVEKAKYQFFGPEPLIAYYLYKEAEIRNIRIILAAKESGLEPEKIRQRLRRLYA